MRRKEQPAAGVWNPYMAGFALGIILLLAFLFFGRGIGASGGVAEASAKAIHVVLPDVMEQHAYFKRYVAGEQRSSDGYGLLLLAGLISGGLLAAMSAGDFRIRVEKGDRLSTGRRFAAAAAGGLLMGYAARLAQGCTSGQALSGGATLAAGSWLFMVAVFAGGYALAWFVRRLWQ